MQDHNAMHVEELGTKCPLCERKVAGGLSDSSRHITHCLTFKLVMCSVWSRPSCTLSPHTCSDMLASGDTGRFLSGHYLKFSIRYAIIVLEKEHCTRVLRVLMSCKSVM